MKQCSTTGLNIFNSHKHVACNLIVKPSDTMVGSSNNNFDQIYRYKTHLLRKQTLYIL